MISASILSADFARLGEDVQAMVGAGADRIHFDVMDNHYVPNLSFGPVVCQALRTFGIQAPIDAHLMVQPVDNLVEGFAAAGATSIVFHPEASIHPARTIALIRATGCEVGLALNPGTPLDVLDWLCEDIDYVLVMSVNPGFGGQQFIPSALEKIQALRAYLGKRPVRIEVDGGIKADNIAKVAAAGADRFVMGSALFGKKPYAATIQHLRTVLDSVR